MSNKPNHRHTVLLPQTSFSMKADLLEKEPRMLQHWHKTDLWKKLRNQSKNRPIFTLHDGPPYANGSIHLGTTLNKILKDIINRYQQMTDKDANYIPGWDCHGLPIEWIVEKQYREKNKEITQSALRLDCAKFSQHWMQIQREQFQRLGVLADWNNAYHTTQKNLEADIVKTMLELLMDDAIHQRYQTVLWSPTEMTSLAESEVEYHTIETKSAYIAFPLHEESKSAFLIWTTALWTVVGNRALAVNPDHAYAMYEVQNAAAPFRFSSIIIAKDRAAMVSQDLNLSLIYKHDVNISEYTHCQHPMRDQGYVQDVPVLSADFVQLNQGTGVVHIAPGHGEDDFNLGKKHDLDLSSTVTEDGTYISSLPTFGGQHYIRCRDSLLQALQNNGCLLGTSNITHSYPHSWRSKQPLIYRSTKQWFIDLQNTGIKQRAIDALQNVNFIPSNSQNRMTSMLQKRPDWLLSRQRSWGVPLTIFVSKDTLLPLKDDRVNRRILEVIKKHGSDAWFNMDVNDFLQPEYDKEHYHKIDDILDIWFESGCSHIFLRNNYDRVNYPVDLYLEGSDQHRGWFQTSLLTACRRTDVAPYKTILTHGFVLDANGHKMSKSLNNVISPQDILQKYGAEIIRLWCVSSDYTKDIKIGDQAMEDHANMYRRVRNTFRFILGNLHHGQDQSLVPYEQLPELEKFVLYELFELTSDVLNHAQQYNIHAICQKLYQFCDTELSGKYFDIWKDTLYCDALNSHRRRSVHTVLSHIFEYLVRMWAPILPFTSEEAWLSRYETENSIHLQQISQPEKIWHTYDKVEKWTTLFDLKKQVQQAMEISKEQRGITSQDDAKLVIYTSDGVNPWPDFDLGSVMLVPQLQIKKKPFKTDKNIISYDIGSLHLDFYITSASGQKCSRCRLQRIKQMNVELCDRCKLVVQTHE